MKNCEKYYDKKQQTTMFNSLILRTIINKIASNMAFL